MEQKVKEQYSFAFERFKDGVGLVRANKRIYEKNYQTIYHTHDYPQIWYCYRGSYQQNLEGEIYECTEGSLMVIPAGVRHDVRFMTEDADVLMLDVSYAAILSAAPDRYLNMVANLCLPVFSKELGHSFPPCTLLSPASRKVVEDVFSWFVLSNYEARHRQHKEEACQKLETLFMIPECALPATFQKKAINIAQNRVYPAFKIISYLNLHYPEKIMEEKLLEVGSISHAGLNRYFKRVAGAPYTRYLLQLRVKRAYTYIRTTTYPLPFISDMCGFYDIFHMSQAFTRYVGERPKKRSMKLREYYGREKDGSKK